MKPKPSHSCAALTFLLGLVLPRLAIAYIGPGAGLTAIGTFLALVAGLLVAIVGFVWYPIKRLIRRLNTVRMRKKDGRAR